MKARPNIASKIQRPDPDHIIVAAGGEIDTADIVAWETDFLGDALPDEVLAGVGSGTGNAVAIAGGVGGMATILTASDDGAIGANGSSLSLGALNWKANQGGLFMEARLKLSAITGVMLFMGFTDALASTVEAPIFLNAADIDSDATDACGILFDTDGSTTEWCHGGVKNNTDTAPAYSGTAPVADTMVDLRVEVSAAGAVQGFVNGVAIGPPVANAVTANVALCPIIFAANRGGSARTVTVDRIKVQGNRA